MGIMNDDVVTFVALVFGCPDISVSANTAIKRHGDTTMVTCLASGQTDVLTCFNDRWMGELVNCSKGRTILALASSRVVGLSKSRGPCFGQHIQQIASIYIVVSSRVPLTYHALVHRSTDEA